MFVSPRIIAIDDETKHLKGLADGLHRCGTSCLPIYFTGDTAGIAKCPGVRLIFADLNLNESGAGGQAGYEKHFGVIGGLLEETFAPSGPYVLILWTRSADQANGLRDFLEARLENVAKPLAVEALDKAVHLDLTTGEVRNPADLVKAIQSIIQNHPQLAALLRWEEHVLQAAAETVAAILALTSNAKTPEGRSEELGRLLARLAVEAVGETHVAQDRFSAVNEALLPILADRIAFLRSSQSDAAIWEKAFDASYLKAPLSGPEAAQLNRMLHLDESDENTGVVRGSVSRLTEDKCGEVFNATFGLDEVEAASTEFGCKSFDPGKRDEFRWMLVQTQAACDFAQRKRGPIPYLLALEMPCTAAANRRTIPEAVWCSPPLQLKQNNEPRCLHVSARFQYALPPETAAKLKASYRLREQLLSEIIHLAHSQGARPGSIKFREIKQRHVLGQP